MARKSKHGIFLTIFFAVISVLYLFPIALVVLNSFKKKAYISKKPFAIPQDKMFVGLENYARGIETTKFFQSFLTSLFITVFSVLAIVFLTSMCAWYISRVKNAFTTAIYYLCLFSMIVPFQMVMFSLSKIANMLHLTNPVGIIVVYVGFGAGLAVFMFCGFVKSIPLEIEEAAMIDGCTPIHTYLVLDMKKWKTLPMAIQYLRGGYGSIDMGAMMGVLVLSMIPIIAFYMACQKHIIEGVVAGAVKG